MLAPLDLPGPKDKALLARGAHRPPDGLRELFGLEGLHGTTGGTDAKASRPEFALDWLARMLPTSSNATKKPLPFKKAALSSTSSRSFFFAPAQAVALDSTSTKSWPISFSSTFAGPATALIGPKLRVSI